MAHLEFRSRVALCLLPLCTNLSYAESYELHTQKVSAHSGPVSHLSEEPVRVEVITKEDLERLHAINLADALRYSAGVQLKPITGKTGEGVWLQGYDSDRVAVLVDGLPIAAGTGSSVDISQIAIGDVERIEIGKGAMSALYGSSAMGGVVNIITRRPNSGQHAQFSYSGGTWGSQDEPYDHMPLGKQHLKVGYSWNTSTQFLQLIADQQVSNGYRSPNATSTQGWDGYRTNVSGKLARAIGDFWSISLTPRLYREDVKITKDNFRGGIGAVPEDKTDITEKDYLAAAIRYKSGSYESSLQWQGENYSNESRQDIVQTAHTEQFRTTDIQHKGLVFHQQYQFNYLNRFEMGVDWLHDQMLAISNKDDGLGNQTRAVEVNNEAIENINGFFQWSQQLDGQWESLLSARINSNPKYGEHVSPMLNLQYFPLDLLSGISSLRFGIGYGYRTPTLKELYHFFDHTHMGYALVGNEALEPESSTNYQATFEWQPSPSSQFDITVYYNEIENLIDFLEDTDVSQSLTDEYGSDDNPYIIGNVYTNIDEAITKGAEINFAHQWSHYLRSSFGYAYLHAKNVNTDKWLTHRPAHDAKVNLDWFITPKLDASVRYRYSSEQFADEANQIRTPAYAQVDLKLNYKWSRNVLLFAGIDNVTGLQKDSFDGNDLRPEEGRYSYLGIKIDHAFH